MAVQTVWQVPLWHWSAAEHVAPSGSCGAHWPAGLQ